MTYEGRLRQHSFRVDRFADKLVFGVLRDEWPAGSSSPG
jgi:RimJ/RimL family protein N-acetyltransferase